VSLTIPRSFKEAKEDVENLRLDSLNPIAIGKRSRQLFDDVWQQFARISSPPQSNRFYDDFQSPAEEFTSPTAQDTTVLVAGATGRVGRILVRKLLLRGYKVRALVRGRDPEAMAAIPQSVDVVAGDIGDYDSCKYVMQGVDKVICSVTARSDLSGDLRRVEELGITNLTKAYMDRQNQKARKVDAKSASRVAKVPLVDFKHESQRKSWLITKLGLPVEKDSNGDSRRRNSREVAEDFAFAVKNEWRDALVFEGAVYSRGGRAEVGGPIYLPEGAKLEGSEGLVLRLGADGNPYMITLTTRSGHNYSTQLRTRKGFQTARMPFSFFRKEQPDAPELKPQDVVSMSLRFELAKYAAARIITSDEFAANPNDFRLEIDWIKALPGGTEADFVLISCVGTEENSGAVNPRRIAAKRRGEDVLRSSGLGYTVVRPGPVVEEPGGYKALVFDQGNRISSAISCADLADVAVKALHDGTARNKTFEICSEITADSGEDPYELIAHLPDRSNNYLTPALMNLEKNT